MSLPFQLQEDKVWRENNSLQPSGLVSLWDMLRFYADKFANICRLLRELSIFKLDDATYKVEFSQPILDQLVWLQELTRNLDLRGPPVALERLLYDLHTVRVGNAQIKRDAHDVLQRIVDEFEGQLILAVPLGSAQFYQVKGTILGEEAILKFSSLTEDAAEAGNCFALGRFTACVFHLMRIMETVVQEFATQIGATKKDGTALNVKEEDWYQIEVAIGRAVHAMPKGDPKDRYSASLASLSAVRAGWRNPTMHPKQTYTEEQARTLIDCVKLFVDAWTALAQPSVGAP